MKIKASLKNFDEKTFHSKLELDIEGKKFELPIHKRLGWKTYAGQTHELFDLVIPKGQNDNGLLEVFGGRRRIPLKVSILDENGKKVVKLIPSGKHPRIPALAVAA